MASKEEIEAVDKAMLLVMSQWYGHLNPKAKECLRKGDLISLKDHIVALMVAADEDSSNEEV